MWLRNGLDDVWDTYADILYNEMDHQRGWLSRPAMSVMIKWPKSKKTLYLTLTSLQMTSLELILHIVSTHRKPSSHVFFHFKRCPHFNAAVYKGHLTIWIWTEIRWITFFFHFSSNSVPAVDIGKKWFEIVREKRLKAPVCENESHLVVC